MRFEDSHGLFGTNSGFGTTRALTCDFCHQTYPEKAVGDDGIAVDNFGDRQICPCCFEKVEKAVLENMGRILPWFLRILMSKKKTIEDLEQVVRDIQKALASR